MCAYMCMHICAYIFIVIFGRIHTIKVERVQGRRADNFLYIPELFCLKKKAHLSLLLYFLTFTWG